MVVTDQQGDPNQQVRVPLASALDLHRTSAIYRYGSGDPAYYTDSAGIWRALGTPIGPATMLSRVDGAVLVVRAWGPGADWVVERAEALNGLSDNPADFRTEHPLVRALVRQFPGVRIARTDLVMESLVPAVLSQKITGKEAFASWRQLLRRYGDEAPGPTPRPMRIPPSAQVLRSLTDAQWHEAGVDQARRSTIRRVAGRAASLERLINRSTEHAAAALQSIRGIGVWTTAEVVERVWGSADHPSFGDYHVPSSVGVALAGRPVDDEGMARLLEPFRPHRGRVVRLIELAGIGKPRRGPRRTVPNYRDI